jgi:nucleotide-binding universal stress UspA family protein
MTYPKLPPSHLLQPISHDPAESSICAVAAAFALRSGSSLTTLHAIGAQPLAQAPDIATLLKRWHLASDALTHQHITELCCDDVGETILKQIGLLQPELLIMGAHPEAHWRRVLRDSVSQQLISSPTLPTLVLPLGREDLLDPNTGDLFIRDLYVAAQDDHTLALSTPWARWLAGISAHREGTIHVLHVGDTPLAAADHCSVPGWRWQSEALRPDRHALEEELVRAVRASGPGSLLIMATHGEDSVYDMLFGTHTERVLSSLDRPLLILPYSRP